MRVFLVDDAKVMRIRIASMVSKIEEAELVGLAVSVAEATAGIAAMRPDVVLLDLKLQDGSGIVVLEFAKRLAPEPDVVMITNYRDPVYRDRCLAAGADFFLDKSTELDQLPDILRRLAAKQPVATGKPDKS